MESPAVLITGGSGGIGSALARRWHARCARLALVGRNEAPLHALADELGALAIPADVTDASQVDGTVASTIEALGALDGVAHCVGSLLLRPAHVTTDTDWQQTLMLNLTSAFFLLRSVTKQQKSKVALAYVSGQVIGVDGGMATLRTMG